MDKVIKKSSKKSKSITNNCDDAVYRAIFDNILHGVISINEKGIIGNINPSAEKIFGYNANEVVGKNINMLMPEPHKSAHDGYLKKYIKTGEAKIIGIGREVRGLRKDETTFPMDLAVSATTIGDERVFVGIVQDITEKKAAEDKIVEQTRMLIDLSTPVLKVWDDVVLLPLIGSIDGDRATQIIENLLEAIVQNNAKVAVIDVTGVSIIDTYVAQHLMKTISAAEMLGARVLITGISPEVAQTLVKLGIDFSTIHACGPLREGIAKAMEMTQSSITIAKPKVNNNQVAPQ